MAALKFAETHNLVAFLENPDESDGFEKIVDFLNAHTIKYALTINPTIYTSCIEQFWATAKVKTVNGKVQLQALVDGKKVIITKTSVKRDLYLEDAEGTKCLPTATIFEELTRMRRTASKQGMKIANIDVDVEVTLVDNTQGRYGDDLMFDTGVLDEQEVEVEKVVTELEEEEEEEERLARQNEEEANVALIESWDNTQAMMDADYQMAQQLQAEEQEQLSIEEKSKLFVQLLEARKKHFAKMRAREKRNKSPTQAQQRKLYCNYLKNMEGYTLKQLTASSFEVIQELVEGSEKRAEDNTKRAGTKLEQEVAKKQKIDDAKVDDDQEEVRMKELMNIVPNEEEVVIDDVPLATKPLCIVD
ncbi:hypothetical protein Tco_1517241 [Tanacetum coccineum]